MTINRRGAIGSMTAAIAAASMPGLSLAQGPASPWPTKPVKLIVPLTAGGPTDLLARILSQPLGERLGQPIVIDNRPGAGGNIGAEAAAKSDPDGYTLFLGTSGPLAINATLYGNLRFDPVKDFAPINLLARAPFVVAVSPKVPVQSITELIAYAKKNPGKLNYGTVVGSAAHLATELFRSAAGIDVVQVPYKGAGPATNDLMAGLIDFSFASTPGVLPQVRAGKLRALAVTSARRLPVMPKVPTLAESGLAGYEASVWYGLVAPTGTPAPVLARLGHEMDTILKDPKIRALMAQNDFDPEDGNAEKFAAFIKSESDKWGKVVRAAGLKAT